MVRDAEKAAAGRVRSVRLTPDEVELLEEVRRYLAETNPQMMPNASDALRFALDQFGTAFRNRRSGPIEDDAK